MRKSIDLINKVCEREALIENIKKELKVLKNKESKYQLKIKNLINENKELNNTLQIKKLQMKVKDLNNSPLEKLYFNLSELLKNYLQLQS